MIIDIYTDKTLIDGKERKGKLSVQDVIEIVEKNVGNLWGFDKGDGTKWGEGAVFNLCLEDNKVSIIGGDRFIQMVTTDDKSKILWSRVLENNINGLTYIGKATTKEINKIKRMDWRALILKP